MKEAIHRMKWQPMELKKNYLQSAYLVRASYPGICKRLMQLIGKEIKQPRLLNEQRKSKCFEKSEE